MRMSAGHAPFGFKAITLLTTLHTLTPLAGIVSFLWTLEAARGGRAQQQRVRCRPLDARDPSTIIPNHHPHAAHVARTPSASTHSRCSYLTRTGCGARGWRRLDEQHGPKTSSIFMGPGAEPWAVLAGRPGAFLRGPGWFYDSRFATFCSRAGGGGGGNGGKGEQ